MTLIAVLIGSTLSASTDAAEPAGAPAVQGAAEVFDSRFVVCRVATDLERRLLGSRGEPLDEASICVFVDSREFADESPISAKSRPVLLLLAWLEDQAKIDDRLALFRIIDGLDGEPFDATQARTEELSQICEKLARQAGYRRVETSQTFGLDWKKRINDAEAAIRQEAESDSQTPPRARAFAGGNRLGVYAVRTHLERLLTSADCVIDVLPALSQTAANHFPDDFIADMQKLIPQLEYNDKREMLVCVHYTKAAAGRLDKWVNDIEGRKALARQFGFELCNLQQTQIAEDQAISP